MSPRRRRTGHTPFMASVSQRATALVTNKITYNAIKDVARMNEVWNAWVVAGQTPAHCCGRIELGDPQCRVEIVAVAAV